MAKSGTARAGLSAFRCLLSGEVPGLTAEKAGRLRAAQVAIVSRMTPFMMLANMMSTAILLVVCAAHPARHELLLWSAAMAAFCAVAMLQWWRGARAPVRERVSRRAIRRVVLSCTIPAVLWGLAGILVFPGSDSAAKLLIASITLGALCAGAFGLSTVAPAAFVYTGLIGLLAMLAIVLEGSGAYTALGVLLCLYTAITWFSISWFNSLFNASVTNAMESGEQQELVGILLRDFQENASDWLFETDAEGRLVTVSPRFVERLGIRESDAVGHKVQDLLETMRPEETEANVPVAADVARRLMQERQPFASVEMAVEWRAERLWWSISGKPILHRDGTLAGFRGVCSDITEAKRSAEKLRHMAHHDSLTGLPNRATLHERIERELAQSAGLALLLVDLDNFKTINDTMGHLAGDALLFEVAARLGRVARPDCLVARLGGDEFAVLVPGSETEPAERLAAAILGALQLPFQLDTSRIHIGASVGIAIAPRDGRTLSDVMRRADLALYAAKSEGRGRTRVFESAFEREARERHALEEDMRVACQHGQLRLVYQPIVDIASSRIVGAEALMRWKHPRHGEVSPARFIPIAEDSGLITAMGEWALGEACREAARWPRDLSIAVNVSAVQMQDRQLALAIAKALQQSGLLPSRLHIEMTESVLIDRPAAKQLFTQLRALGVTLSLDDFGTGYSSLSYLRLFPFDRIKIDQSFVRESVGRSDCVAIVHAIARLARDLGIETVAEGVETEAELCVVSAAGCHHAQGYHFGRPMEAADFLHLVGMAEPAQLTLGRPA